MSFLPYQIVLENFKDDTYAVVLPETELSHGRVLEEITVFDGYWVNHQTDKNGRDITEIVESGEFCNNDKLGGSWQFVPASRAQCENWILRRTIDALLNSPAGLVVWTAKHSK